jgi:transcriptional adapter 3
VSCAARGCRSQPILIDFAATEEPVKLKGTPDPVDSPSPAKKTKLSPGTSSLSEVADSPRSKSPGSKKSAAASDVSMSDGEENTVIHKPPTVPQKGYFPDPLGWDPTVYHIEEVTPDMSDAEKKRIYSVTAYPTKDLSDQIAGQPPDKDFSNAKPSNQVAATTFLTYADPFLRPLTEEDIAFLRERGDRTTPFLAIPRGKRSYKDIWAEEDGEMVDASTDKGSLSAGRGNLEQLNDETATTDSIGTGPLASRLLSLLKFEHRSEPAENGFGNGMDFMGDGNDTMDLDGLTNGHENGEKQLPPAAGVSDLVGSKASQKLDYVSSEERIKGELRHLGLLGPDEHPDFDAHHDDDISERIRLLQHQLRKVMVTNGARKARLLDLAKERMAYQEYSTIHEDLDSQVQQAYLKRTRTLGKAKKGGPGAKPRPGHVASALGARDIGDSARMLMDRRKRWEKCIGPVFGSNTEIRRLPGKDTTIWHPDVMKHYEKQELETLEEDEDGE